MSPSPRISRPSASVLITSTVSPLRFQNVAGLDGAATGMFSVAGTIPMTRIGVQACRSRAWRTQYAPPAMSSFIRSMPSAGLIEMPPVSNDALPHKAEHRSSCPGGLWRKTIRRGGSLLPLATPQESHVERGNLMLVENFDRRAAFAAIVAARGIREGQHIPGSFAS